MPYSDTSAFHTRRAPLLTLYAAENRTRFLYSAVSRSVSSMSPFTVVMMFDILSSLRRVVLLAEDNTTGPHRHLQGPKRTFLNYFRVAGQILIRSCASVMPWRSGGTGPSYVTCTSPRPYVPHPASHLAKSDVLSSHPA